MLTFYYGLKLAGLDELANGASVVLKNKYKIIV
jgi:hypothetical protein